MSTRSENAHKTAGLVYCLWLLGILFGITAIIGVIISHANLAKARGTHVYRHFIWQIFSFWLIFSGIALVYYLWPHSSATPVAIVCFLIWLFSGLIGSWLLSKSNHLRTSDKPQYNQHHHYSQDPRNFNRNAH